jgi:Tol biopolymer transport system component
MPISTQEAWLRGAQEGSIGGWSPDGRRLVLDLSVDGNSDIYVSGTSGGQPLRLTSEPSEDVVPSWSPDGRWIYFASDRTGSFQVWKVPAEGGQPTQVSFQGGFGPQPSVDGQHIFYLADSPGRTRPNVIKRVPSNGGEETALVEGVSAFYWSVGKDAIYFLTLEQGRDYLDRYDPTTHQRRRIGLLPFQAARGFCGFMSISPDGRSLLANHVDRYESNLGLIDGFR